MKHSRLFSRSFVANKARVASRKSFQQKGNCFSQTSRVALNRFRTEAHREDLKRGTSIRVLPLQRQDGFLRLLIASQLTKRPENWLNIDAHVTCVNVFMCKLQQSRNTLFLWLHTERHKFDANDATFCLHSYR